MLPPVCGLFPKGFVNASGAVLPGPDSWSSVGGGNARGGDGENNDFAGVIMVVPAVERGIYEPGRNEVSSGVMTKPLGIIAHLIMAKVHGVLWSRVSTFVV